MTTKETSTSATEFIVHHGGPHANPLITKALNATTTQVVEKIVRGPAIGSGGFVESEFNEPHGCKNHEENDPRK